MGGNAPIKMAELKDALTSAGLADVRTYIQSGNIIFSSSLTDDESLQSMVGSTIRKRFGHKVDVAVFNRDEWKKIVESAPDWWGVDPEWKHNLLIMIKPYDMKEVIAAIGELKPDIEAIQPGDGVVYQSMSKKLFGRTTTGKLASNPVYKKMTVRNYNTATKLLSLLDKE